MARPCDPGVLLIVATTGDEEAHSTLLVRSVEVPSEKFPVAVNWLDPPGWITEPAGFIVIEASTAFVIVRLALPKTDPELAVIVDAPALAPLAKP
jgi:hypothetical protein